MRTVRDILNSKTKSLNIISQEETVYKALQMLNSVNLSYLVVMDNEEYKGIISERDYSRKVILKGRHSSDTKVKDIMSVDVPMVSVNDTVEKCFHLIDDHKTRYLLAFDDKQFAGVITINDLLRQVLAARSDVFDSGDVSRLLDNDEKIF
ncbi:MAG: CBS domain-containing protein [Bacteroidetes bacterium]|nr:MAG: CBS domain-containing protein [Bacteroidota bacterium]